MSETILNIRQQLRMAMLKILARQGPATFFVSVINAVVVYFVLADVEAGRLLWSWLSATVAFNALRIVMVVVFWRMSDDDRYGIWTTLYLLLIYCTGICWGLLPLFPAFFEVSWVQGFIVFVVAGMSAGGILSLYVMLPAAIPYFLLTVTPMIFVFAQAGEPHYVAMSFLTGMFLLILIRITYSFNEIARKTVRLELENEQMFHFLLEARESQDATLRDYRARTDKTWII